SSLNSANSSASAELGAVDDRVHPARHGSGGSRQSWRLPRRVARERRPGCRAVGTGGLGARSPSALRAPAAPTATAPQDVARAPSAMPAPASQLAAPDPLRGFPTASNERVDVTLPAARAHHLARLDLLEVVGRADADRAILRALSTLVERARSMRAV